MISNLDFRASRVPGTTRGTSSGRRWLLDAALHISPYFEVKGRVYQYLVANQRHGNLAPRGWWIQPAYKLAGLNQNLNLPFINNLELVGRYDRVNDGLGTKTDRETVGFVYYLTNTLLFEGDYEWLQSRGPNTLPSPAVCVPALVRILTERKC